MSIITQVGNILTIDLSKYHNDQWFELSPGEQEIFKENLISDIDSVIEGAFINMEND